MVTLLISVILNKIKHNKTLTPVIIIIGEVVNHYTMVQDYLDIIPSDMVEPIGILGFDIWKNKAVTA